MQLYSYWRSTTSYRVRIGLHLKGLAFETLQMDLMAGDQHDEKYASINPGQGVPSLILEDGTVLTQSMDILAYLDEITPDPALAPADPVRRAQMMAAAYTIATDIHPVNNLKVVDRLTSELGASPEMAKGWMCHWMHQGFCAYQALVAKNTRFSFADTPQIADLCLIPQLFNARRWDMDLTPFGRLIDIETAALALPAFQAAHPKRQPGAEKGK